MTIHLPVDLETSIAAIVQSGHFRSVDDAMAEAARLLLKQVGPVPAASAQTGAAEPIDPLSGIWHDYADEMDKIVVEAYRQREADTWRAIDVE